MKIARKSAALAFYHAFYTENWAKNRENPYFSLKREYLKITPKLTSRRRKVLESWNLAKLYTKIVQKKFLATFLIFDFFAEIWGAAGKKSQKIENFGLQRPIFWQKSWKSKKWQKFFFVLFLCTTWSNFSFLALFYGD